MATDNKFYVTTPIYYVNDKPHLGHVYTTMVADVVARYHRLHGDQTFFLTGVDEHAAKVSDKAAENDMTPQQWADQNAAAFKETFAKLEMTHNDFVRTSSDLHKEKVTAYVTALLKSGDVYEGEYVGWYDAGQEEYVPENKAKDYDYKSPVNGKPLVKKTEKNYFFKLSAYRDELIEFFAKRDKAGKPFVMPQARKNEILNRIKEAQDVPISRTGSNGWGIPVPGDDVQTIYVWIDALFNYLTYMDSDERRPYWDAGPVHFMAKDILWFHAAIWPALLMALAKCDGYQWVFSENVGKNIVVYSHSYWVSASGEKMSKSLGNFLDPQAIDNYVGEFGLDALRYFLATRGPLGTTDSAFSPDLFAEVYNSDLANTFGNSASRVTNMINKYFDGKLPEAAVKVQTSVNYSHTAEEVLRKFNTAGKALDLSGAADAALSLVRAVDGYIEETAPFKLAKDESKLPEVATILYNCAEALRIVSVLLWPFIPDQCEVFWQRIGCSEYAQALTQGEGKISQWCQWGQLKPGTDIQKGDPLFPRYQVK
ncbi:MAG TPA: methionine--tRNA ligase [Phycisphaerales bacterium]|nr:methionine--tRNA ligase [Phycisphaerales bacterium]|tara:strand:+ start:100040 stop:101656 length:1617 start_codon:yes stop_codon:yes gene_type:complete